MNAAVEAVPPRRRHPALLVWGGLLVALVVGVVVGEVVGWPFLAAPLERRLAAAIDRPVSLGAGDAAVASGDNAAAAEAGFRVRFLGAIRLTTPRFEIAAPAWSQAPHLVRATDLRLRLRYTDLWRAWRGQRLRIDRLGAATLDAELERLADGRVSWQFKAPATPPEAPPPLPAFGQLRVVDGTVRYRDAPLAIVADARLSLVERGAAAAAAVPGAASAASRPPIRAASAASAEPAAANPSDQGSVLTLAAKGHFGSFPLTVDLRSAGVMPWGDADSAAAPLPVTLRATVGRAVMAFDGSARDPLKLQGLAGHFKLSGPSLAAVGDPVGVTLPTTAAFDSEGTVVQQGMAWLVKIDRATVGASRLNGAFRYDRGRKKPLLAGRLGGSRLLLSDLGPAVGTTSAVVLPRRPARAAAAAAPASASPIDALAAAPVPLKAQTRGQGKLLPNRPFDLPALRAMDADVLIDLREVDLNTSLLEPLRPLHVHLLLQDGVLALRDLDARAAQGRLTGNLQLDGNGSVALWSADLGWQGVRLESWIHQSRAGTKQPYVSGRLDGHAKLTGRGRSTAEILASLDGKARTELRGGAMSHLAIEAAGLDLAQALGMMVKGDEMLPVHCAVADLTAKAGEFRPQVMVVDTSDSTIWIDGKLSLATEALDLRAVVSPKDASPLTLRTPLLVRGSFADPKVSIEKGPMARKLAASALLSLINPLAALIPLIDTGDKESAARGLQGCQAVVARRGAVGKAPPR